MTVCLLCRGFEEVEEVASGRIVSCPRCHPTLVGAAYPPPPPVPEPEEG